MRPAFVLLAALSLVGCRSASEATQVDAATRAASESVVSATVWAVDLVETFPGQQARYLQFNALNWVPMREAFVAEGIARSFQVLILPPDSPSSEASSESGRGWDVMLMTEYVDAATFARREEVFREVAARPGYELKRVDGLGPRDLARVVTSYEMRDGRRRD